MSLRSSIDQHTWWNKVKAHRYIRISLFFILGMVTYGLLVSNVIPDTFEVELGTISEQDIRSPLTIENREETDRLRLDAYESVEPVYSLKPRYAQNQIERIQDVFHTVKQVRAEADLAESEFEIDLQLDVREDAPENDETLDMTGPISTDDMLEKVRTTLTQQTSDVLSDETLITLLESSSENLQMAQETTTSVVDDVMNIEIPMDQVSEAKDQAEEKVLTATANFQLSRAMIEIARFGITPNYMLDEEATLEAREMAQEQVEPVMVREGQLLVEEGQVITSELYQKLSLVGLTEEVTMFYPYIGLAIIVILLISMLGYYLSDAKTSLKTNNTHLLMYSLIYILSLGIMKLVSIMHGIELDGITYIAPVAMGTMLLTILLNARIALFTSMVFAIIASIMFNNQATGILDYSHGVYIFFSGIAGVFFLNKSHRVMRVLQAGMFVAIINILVVMALLMLKNAQYGWMDIGSNFGFAVLSGFIAAVLTIGLLPFIEAGFGVLSNTKLIELSNPNDPLLRKILLEAPGTYHHSVMVANLAEAACEAVGANGLLARVGAYYHDIGKTRRPHFFIENQMKMGNPHDKLSPQLSKTIIIAHPYDGAEMLRANKLPKELIDIAEQHHGTTLLKFFYYKAKQELGEDVSESDYRYPGPKAMTKESAIVGIADAVEAAVRSMQNPTPEKIESLVRKIISDRLEDGQFDMCDLTLKELNTLATSLLETMQGTFHSRIEYPDDEIAEKKEG
ncbi:HD family phosphohydrolase [Salipaludibacillus sp. CF4.18]|uniref:HD family phosphohydrolase n=1 Tax=Salipaludibacillus sp. CF4.18 TaxID=3373081 RepID=UPI003EE7DF80